MWSSFKRLLAATALLVSVVHSSASITELTGSTLDQFIADNEYTFVEFYAPWCGHCKNLVPVYAKFPQAAKVLDVDLKIAKIDASEYKEDIRKYGIKGFPSLRFFIDGAMTVLELKEMPTPESLTEWVRKKLLPPFVELSTEADVAAHIENGNSIVGFSAGSSDDAFAAAFAGATRSVDDTPVALVTGPNADAIAKAVGVAAELPATALFTPGSKFAKPYHIYDGDLKNTSTFMDFVADSTTPLVESWGTYGRKLMKGAGPPFAALVFAEQASDDVWEFARQTYGDVAVVQVDISGPRANAKLLDAFGRGADKEAITVVKVKGMTKFKYEPNHIDSIENLKAFIEGIKDGSIEAKLKSAEPPAKPTVGGLTTIVGTTFKDIILDPTKHALVEFYAPWCGHCKNLVPIYEKVAKRFEDTDNVVVAKCDATLNEVDGIYVKSFPTIKYFGPDNEEQDYKGGRTADDFIAFLQEKSSSPTATVEISSDGSAKPVSTSPEKAALAKSQMPQASVELVQKFMQTFKFMVIFAFDSTKIESGKYEMDVAYQLQEKLKSSNTPVLCIQIDASKDPSVKDFMQYDDSQPAMALVRDGVVDGAVPLGDDVQRIMGAVVTGILGSFARMTTSQEFAQFVAHPGKSVAVVGPDASFTDVKSILAQLIGIEVGIARFTPDFVHPPISSHAVMLFENNEMIARIDAPYTGQDVLDALRSNGPRTPIAQTTALDFGNNIHRMLLFRMRRGDSMRPYHAYFVGSNRRALAEEVTKTLNSPHSIVVKVPDKKAELDAVIALCDGNAYSAFIWNSKTNTSHPYEGPLTASAFKTFHDELLGVNTPKGKLQESKHQKEALAKETNKKVLEHSRTVDKINEEILQMGQHIAAEAENSNLPLIRPSEVAHGSQGAKKHVETKTTGNNKESFLPKTTATAPAAKKSPRGKKSKKGKNVPPPPSKAKPRVNWNNAASQISENSTSSQPTEQESLSAMTSQALLDLQETLQVDIILY